MGYSYAAEKQGIFTEDGQVMFLSIRDRVRTLTDAAGACTIEKAIQGQTGDSWRMLACVDRLGELGEIKVIMRAGAMTQHNIIVRAK